MKGVKIVHIFIFVLFLGLFFSFFRNGFVLYGDFSTTFLYKKLYFLYIFPYAWLGNGFIGYETIFFILLRMPFYFLSDLVNSIFNFNNYWIFFVVMYFLRYYFFYKLLEYFDVRKVFAVLIAFIYSINFYFLDRLGAILISFASIAIPIFVLSYFNLSKKISIKYRVVFIFSLWILMSDMHVLLMTAYFSIIMFFFSLYEEIKRKNIISFLRMNFVVGSLCLIVLSYSIIPLFYLKFISRSGNVIDQVAGQTGGWIYSLGKTTLLTNSLSGTGYYYSQLLEHHTMLLVALIFYIGSIFIILILNNKNKGDYRYNFFFISFLFFTFLSSISLVYNSIPFLKQYLIGFDAIKDNSYFMLYSQFSLFVLLGLSVKQIKAESVNKLVVVFLLTFLCFLSFVNVYAFKNFDYFKTTKIPASYYELSDNEKLGNQERILVLPLGWITKFNWSNGIMSGFFNMFLAEYEIVGQNIIEGPNKSTQDKINNFNQCFVDNCPDLSEYIKEIGIKKILDFHNANDVSSSLESSEPLSYDLQINYLIKTNLIKELYQSSDYSIYEIIDKKFIEPKINSNNISFKEINPTKYKIYINNLKNPQDLSFLESFNENWKLYLKQNPARSWCEKLHEYHNDNDIIECKKDQKFFEGEELSYLYKRPIFDDTHKLVNQYANQWTIDPNYIKQNFPKDSYKQNPDGSINVELTLFFKPQSYFYFGLIVSGATLLGCLSYLGWDFVNSRKRKSAEAGKDEKIGIDKSVG